MQSLCLAATHATESKPLTHVLINKLIGLPCWSRVDLLIGLNLG